MKVSQKFGGAAALYQAGAYLAAMIYFLLISDYISITDPLAKMAFLVENQAEVFLLYMAAYIFFGFALVVLSMVLYRLLRNSTPLLAGTAAVVGFIWAGMLIASGMIFTYGMKIVLTIHSTDPAQAASAWLIIEAIAGALSSGNGEFLGGTWTLLNSLAAFQVSRIPKSLNILGLVVGIAGLLSAVPPLNILAAVFGLLQLFWFIGWGLFLLRQNAATEE